MKSEIDNAKVEYRAWRGAIEERTKELETYPNNLQNIHTPFDLCNCIISKLKEQGGFEDKTFLTINLEVVEVLIYDFGVARDKIYFITDCPEKVIIAKSGRYNGINVIKDDYLKWEPKMKFDNMLGNPPYQSGGEKSAVSSQLWDKFVTKSFSLCKDGGHVALIHPSPWRKPESKLYNEFRNRQLKYLEIHNLQDGMKTFNCATRYDWYILKNEKGKESKVIIKDENGEIVNIKMSEWDFLPNCDYRLFEKIIAKDGVEKCEVIYNRGAYGRDKAWMSKEETGEHKYPCVTMMTKATPVTFFWSNTNKSGHFGIPKVIVNLTGSTLCCLVDDKGKYGMTQWTFGIKIDSKEEGEKIKEALMSEEFNKIWQATQWLSMTREWRIFKSFKKNWYKEF